MKSWYLNCSVVIPKARCYYCLLLPLLPLLPSSIFSSSSSSSSAPSSPPLLLSWVPFLFPLILFFCSLFLFLPSSLPFPPLFLLLPLPHSSSPSSSSCFFIEMVSHYTALAVLELIIRQGWPQTRRDPPASAFLVCHDFRRTRRFLEKVATFKGGLWADGQSLLGVVCFLPYLHPVHAPICLLSVHLLKLLDKSNCSFWFLALLYSFLCFGHVRRLSCHYLLKTIHALYFDYVFPPLAPPRPSPLSLCNTDFGCLLNYNRSKQ